MRKNTAYRRIYKILFIGLFDFAVFSCDADIPGKCCLIKNESYNYNVYCNQNKTLRFLHEHYQTDINFEDKTFIDGFEIQESTFNNDDVVIDVTIAPDDIIWEKDLTFNIGRNVAALSAEETSSFSKYDQTTVDGKNICVFRYNFNNPTDDVELLSKEFNSVTLNIYCIGDKFFNLTTHKFSNKIDLIYLWNDNQLYSDDEFAQEVYVNDELDYWDCDINYYWRCHSIDDVDKSNYVVSKKVKLLKSIHYWRLGEEQIYIPNDE